MTNKEILKQLKSLRIKLNIHKAKYSQEQILSFQNEIERLDSMLKGDVNSIENIENPIQMQENPIEPKEEDENKEIVNNENPTPSVETPIEPNESVEKISLDDDDFLKNLGKPVYKAPTNTEIVENKEEIENSEDDFDEITKEVEKEMQAIDEKIQLRQEDEAPIKKLGVELDKNDSGDTVTVKLKPHESSQFITKAVSSLTRDLLPEIYAWSLWTKEQQEDLAKDSHARRIFAKKQKLGQIPKDEVYFTTDSEDEYIEELKQLYDRIEQYKEDAPLSSEEEARLNLALEVYLSKKKIELSPEFALFSVAISLMLPRLSPIVREKAKVILKKIDSTNEDRN